MKPAAEIAANIQNARASTGELINIHRRLRRIEELEAEILSRDNPDFKALNTISLLAARLKRQYSATFKELYKKDRENAGILHRQTNPEEFGFVFTIEAMDDYIRRKGW
jgi:hypothetical protein